MKNFANYVADQEPLPWTVISDHPNIRLVGNQDMAINYARFNLIMDAIHKYFQNGLTVLDIGVYPGIMPKIFHEFYPKSGYEYCGCGLGFDQEFTEKMKSFNVRLLECDLDPRLHLTNKREVSIPMEDKKADLCIFTDVIEHFYDPFYALKEINRVCKPGAIMILTTDNLTRLGSMISLLKGKSCNVPLIASNLFYQGDWRPHFREYSRDELFKLLEWSGFKVISHTFYEAEFGHYRVVNKCLTKTRNNRNNTIKSAKKFIKKMIVKFIPHLRDNHIIIARKEIDYKTMIDLAPKITEDIDQWVLQRKLFSHKS